MDHLRINFVLPPTKHISGGPLAILEYANRFAARGHVVSVTTYPDNTWEGDDPFPWWKLDGTIHYTRTNDRNAPILLPEARALVEASGPSISRTPLSLMSTEWATWLGTAQAIPDCDINIATFWSTAFPVYYSNKGKPVIFLQHYEEVFYQACSEYTIFRLLARDAMALPIYKIANSSWLQRQISGRFGQLVPFSNNAIEQNDFRPCPKKSRDDGILRVVTYSRPEEWKGFSDAVVAMAKVRARYGRKVEWHVFGYEHGTLGTDNSWAPYTYHPKLSFRQLSELYASADVVLCPSWYESFPLPPLEGMASGTAVVTTGAGTEDYAFHEVNALVIASRDPDGMAAAVCRLIEDETLRATLVSAGLKTARTYTWDRAVQEREAMLVDIHYDRISYDRFKGVSLGLTDVTGREFERAPVAVLPKNAGGLYWSPAGHLFLLHDGMQRHVQSGDLVPVLVERGWMYIEMDELQIARIPAGFPLRTANDVPYCRQDASDA